jgi:hypothetical protein
VESSSILEPATADGAVAIAAFPHEAPAVLEDYSSMGPRNPEGGGPFEPSAVDRSLPPPANLTLPGPTGCPRLPISHRLSVGHPPQRPTSRARQRWSGVPIHPGARRRSANFSKTEQGPPVPNRSSQFLQVPAVYRTLPGVGDASISETHPGTVSSRWTGFWLSPTAPSSV